MADEQQVTLSEIYRCVLKIEDRLNAGDARFREHGELLVRLEERIVALQCELRKGRRHSVGAATVAGGFLGGAVAAFINFFRGS